LRTCFALSGLNGYLDPNSQGVALGCIVMPFQGNKCKWKDNDKGETILDRKVDKSGSQRGRWVPFQNVVMFCEMF
jgi:hypothetical protein